jgi:hypothetical protein
MQNKELYYSENHTYTKLGTHIEQNKSKCNIRSRIGRKKSANIEYSRILMNYLAIGMGTVQGVKATLAARATQSRR